MGEPSRQIDPTVPSSMKSLTQRAENAMGRTRTPVTPYNKPFVNPASAGENRALESLRSLTYGYRPLYGRGTQMLSDTLGGRYLDPESNPYLSKTADVITKKAREGFGRELDMVDSGANRSGAFYSTGAARLRGDAADRFGQNLTNSLSALYGDNYTRERGNMLSALSPALSYDQIPFSMTSSLYGAEALPRTIADRQLAGQYQDFLRTNEETRYQNELPYNQLLSLLDAYPLAYPQYTPGRSAAQDFSDIAGGVSNLALLAMMA